MNTAPTENIARLPLPYFGSNFFRALRTVRYLQPLQVPHLLLRPLRKRTRHLAMGGRRNIVAINVHARDRIRAYLQLEATILSPYAADLNALNDRTMSLSGELVAFPDTPWEVNTNLMSRLSFYQLHYTYFAHAAALAVSDGDHEPALCATEWLQSWTKKFPPGRAPAWDPYPVSRRLINWASLLSVIGSPDQCLLSSYEQQWRYLRRNLEWDLLANHLLVNIIACAMAESVLTGRPRFQTLALLRAQLGDQILSDGGHFERSPMYHASLLHDLLRLKAALPEVPDWYQKTLDHMCRFLAGIAHPDGDIPLIHDAALGEAPRASDLLRLAGHEGAVSDSFRDSGFYILRSDAMRILVFAGPLGPAYQPGHAHADIFSYELSVGTRRVIVDSGTHGYAGSTFREYNRSARAHNTVQVGEMEPIEAWSTFRVGRRYEVKLHAHRNTDLGLLFHAEHDGYRPWRHQRLMLARNKGGLLVADVVEGPRAVDIKSYIHLHPDVNLETKGDELLLGDSGLLLVPYKHRDICIQRGEENPQQGWYSPRFGEAIPSSVVILSASAPKQIVCGYAIVPAGATDQAHLALEFDTLLDLVKCASD